MVDDRFYATQSMFTDPGSYAGLLDELPDDLAAVREVARGLVFHYRAGGDCAGNGIDEDRLAEIDTRYADRMFARLVELADQPLALPRPANRRLVGCCRDFTVLFLAIARHKGWASRARVGFATYFETGWYVDHVIAEVWDEPRQRWRLIETEIADGHLDPSDGVPIDPLDVPADHFVVGTRAWLSCRAGKIDAGRFVVDPGLTIPATRGWPYVRHNLVHDLAALAKHEMVLWDDWGLTELDGEPSAEQLASLDEVAAAASSSHVRPHQLLSLFGRDGFTVPPVVTSHSPACAEPLRVALRTSV